MQRLGVDIGGTFTDLVCLGSDGSVEIGKVFSTPSKSQQAVVRGIEGLRSRSTGDPYHLTHSSTIGTNALLTRKGARVGLIVTEGFEHVLHIARGRTPGPLSGWISFEKPDPAADLVDTRSVPERVTARGEVMTPLEVDRVVEAGRALVEAGVEALAISFLHSYANPDHERRAKDALLEAGVDVPIVTSSETMPQFREYERTQTTVVNAQLVPVVRGLCRPARGRRAREGGTRPQHPALRWGTHATCRGRHPAGAHRALGAGGRSDRSRSHRKRRRPDRLHHLRHGRHIHGRVPQPRTGRASTSRETRIGNIELAIPIVDIVTVGAGGGSIAHVPEATGALRVGPKSAGADPGPACYGRGGAGPTVTDANLLLGFLPPRILAGELSLDIEAAAAALEPVASSLDVTLHEAAEGIYRVVNENMLGALRVVSSQRGHDPRRMGLIAFGGAGPMHAAAMAEILGTWPVVVPPNPGVLCALGCAIAEYRAEFSQAIARRLEQLDPTTIVDVLDGMREQVAAWLSEHDVGASGQGRSVVEADLRYFRQGFELTIELSEQDVEDIESGRFDSLGQRFAEDHRRLYGFALDTSIELVNLRCVALARADQPELRWQAAAPGRRRRHRRAGAVLGRRLARRHHLRPQRFGAWSLDLGASTGGRAHRDHGRPPRASLRRR